MARGCSASGSVRGGQATYATSSLTGGPHNITAEYSGDGTWPSASAAYGLTVNAAVTLTLTSSSMTPAYGQPVTLTVNATAAVPPGFAAPTGQVTFFVPGAALFSQPTQLGSASLVSGTAALTVNSLAAGSQTITAQYSGDSIWTSSSGSITITVSPVASNSTLSLSLDAGQVVLAAMVAPAGSGGGIPTGDVQFVDTSTNTPVGSATLANGKASLKAGESAAATVLGRPVAAIYSGDSNFKGSTSAPLPAIVNATASFSASFATDEIDSIFGIPGLKGDTPATIPLPDSLDGVTIKVTDSAGTDRVAPLYGAFASANQVNFMIPAGAAPGLAILAITVPSGGTITTAIEIAGAAPGIFTANQTGQGPYAGQIIYAHADGTQTVVNSVAPGSGSDFSPNPMSMSAPGDQVYLVLYGTGIRHAATVTAAINGVNVPVAFCGAQGTYEGLDQLNLGPLPSTIGAGVLNLVITADGQAANIVTLAIQQ